MRQQQLTDEPHIVRGSALQDALQVRVRIEPIELGRLDQAHDSGRAMPPPQRAGEQPVGAPERDRADLVLYPVVVDRQLPIVDAARERSQSLQAVVQGIQRQSLRAFARNSPRPGQRISPDLPGGPAAGARSTPWIDFWLRNFENF